MVETMHTQSNEFVFERC